MELSEPGVVSPHNAIVVNHGLSRRVYYAAIQMHDAFAVLVIAEGFERERKQRRFLFGKHGGDLPFG